MIDELDKNTVPFPFLGEVDEQPSLSPEEILETITSIVTTIPKIWYLMREDDSYSKSVICALAEQFDVELCMLSIRLEEILQKLNAAGPQNLE